MVVFLRDLDPSGDYNEIAYGQVFETDWAQGTGSFVKKTITLSGLNYTVKAGHQLEAKLLVGKASKHHLRFAYDTVSYPSVITLPTWVNVAIATRADFPTSTNGGDTMYGEGGRDFMFGQGNGTQSADEGDPDDEIDNDRDGRESPGSVDYDCEDSLDNDGDGDIDGSDLECKAAIDEDASWHGDEMRGGDGDDYMEGNHGADWMFGDADDDDMIGGSSAGVDPVLGGSVIVVGGIGGDVPADNLLDGNDVMSGGSDDDVMLGDNGTIVRLTGDDGLWLRWLGGLGSFDIVRRATDMARLPEAVGAFGHDYIDGNGGHDDMYGQLGHDLMLGSEGEDAIVGDRGLITNNLLGDGDADPPELDMLSTAFSGEVEGAEEESRPQRCIGASSHR